MVLQGITKTSVTDRSGYLPDPRPSVTDEIWHSRQTKTSVTDRSGHLPDPQHVVIACRDTTEDDINLLLGRCFHPALWKAGSAPLYMIVNAHLLAIDVQDVLVRTLKSYRKEFPDARCRLAITH